MSSAPQPSGPRQRKKGSKQLQHNYTSLAMSPIPDPQKAQVYAQATEGTCVSQPAKMTTSLPSRPSLTIDQALSKTKRKALIKAYKAEERERKEKANEAVEGEAMPNSRPLTRLDAPASISVSTLPSSHTRNHQTLERQVPTKISYRVPGKPYGEKKQEAKVSPSAASGGIPKPTMAYIAKATPIPTPLEEPQHLLVVIDLNGTILYRPSKLQPKKFVQRPHARRFLQYCLDTFTVIIWSSARRENVEGMCQAFLTDELAGKITAVWGRDKLGLSPADYNQRVQVYKRLTRLWDDPQVKGSHPEFERGGRWDQTNTVLIDDSLEKAKSEPFNLIEVPEYFGDSNEPHNILPQVHDYINWLSCHSNVSSAIRTKPFRATTLEGRLL